MTRDEIGLLVAQSIRSDPMPWQSAARALPEMLQRECPQHATAKPGQSCTTGKAKFGSLLDLIWDLVDRYRRKESAISLRMKVDDARELLLIHGLITIEHFPCAELGLQFKWGEQSSLNATSRAMILPGLVSDQNGQAGPDWDRYVDNAISVLDQAVKGWRGLSAQTSDTSGFESQDVGQSVVSFTKTQILVLKTMYASGPQVLMSVNQIRDEMPLREQICSETIRRVLNQLIQSGLVERPDGSRMGARLTTRGRRIVGKMLA